MQGARNAESEAYLSVGELSSTAQRGSSVQQGLCGGCSKRGVDVFHTHIHRLDLGVVRNGLAPVLTTDTGEFVATHRHFRRGGTVAVDPADAGLDLVNHPV